jgi:DNA-binding beta-propeller fold protein YncE
VGGERGCGRARGLGEPRGVAVSPGGGSVYVTSLGSDAVAVFRRSGRTGALRQLRGRAGCLRQRGGRGCGRGLALRNPVAIAVSGDGRNVYVASGAAGGAIAAFRRSRRTGALRQLRGSAGCVSDSSRSGCRDGRALARPSGLALSPSGRFLYAASERGGIAVFRRSTRTGRLVQLARADGCVTAKGLEGCSRGRAIPDVRDVAVDRGGRNLYATSLTANAVAVFDRLRGGVPRQLPGTAGCISEGGTAGCTPARTLLGAVGLAESPSGLDNLYAAASFKAAVAILARDPANGALTQPPGPTGCIRDSGSLGCAVARRMTSPEVIELSEDGRNAYLTTGEDDSLVVLRRNRTTGELSQLPGKAGCLRSSPASECASSGGLRGAQSVALSRDGRSVYVVWRDSNALAVYRRAG